MISMAQATAYTFSYRDLAKATGLAPNTIAQHRTRGHFDPKAIESVAIYLVRYGRDELRVGIVAA